MKTKFSKAYREKKENIIFNDIREQNVALHFTFIKYQILVIFTCIFLLDQIKTMLKNVILSTWRNGTAKNCHSQIFCSFQ